MTKKISKAEWRRLQKLDLFEAAARQKGFSSIAGIDEAGRGPLAGPVVAAACIIPEAVFIPDVDDSKKLTPQKRSELFEILVSDGRIHFGIGVVENSCIDSLNILQATLKAMHIAVANLSKTPDFLLVDGSQFSHPTIPFQKIVKGDSLSHSIAAASIVAKETRDRLMVGYHQQWPQYGFAQHKGYGTPEHLAALKEHGPCPIHRFSFEPVAKSKGMQ